ncbi:mitofusin-2-like [Stylophora pistillata]|uniref:mitofusin-2-like n=1 Tax=Stylophora pistillata TaxID=50429 RepID=UPI000C055B86|nr:mitofusin-2-like [Stylophora pistillata]
MEAIRQKLQEAEDIAVVIDVMQNLDIPITGCKNMEDMKEKILAHLTSQGDTHLASNEAFKVISDAQSMEKRKSFTLLKYYEEVQKEIESLDANFLDLLKTSEGDVLSKMRKRMKRMENRDYVVLVAGETSAGKSSMLNLILGEELLPFSVLSTTSTICELKHGRERTIKIHYKDERKAPKEKILEESSPYKDQISEFVHVKSADLREKASDYKKVELFWPHALLQDGVVIVDSPGVGESDIMDKIVMNYLPNAFAFIYVINSNNAGGVQKDRLVNLLHKTRYLTIDQQMEFSPDCTLFVCNKWDTIPTEERTEVIAHIINKLSQCLPGFDKNTQIIRLSTTKALAAQKFGVMNSEFASLTEKIGRLVTKSIETRLEQHWSWLYHLLSRVIWLMNLFITNVTTDHVAARQRCDVVIERLKKLQVEQESSKKDFAELLKDETHEAIKALIKHLNSPKVKECFGKWNSDELPAVEKSWEVAEAAIEKLFQRRLQMFIEEWEEQYQHFAGARKFVVDCFLGKYNYLERELRNIEVSVSQIGVHVDGDKTWEPVKEQVFNGIYNFSLPFEGKVPHEILVPVMIPGALVLAALAVPVTLLYLP